MGKTYITIIALSFILGLFSLAFPEDSVTITTYYPSPYGSYNELTTASNTYLATDEGNVGIGTTQPSYKLVIAESTANSNPIVQINNTLNDVNSQIQKVFSVYSTFNGYTSFDIFTAGHLKQYNPSGDVVNMLSNIGKSYITGGNVGIGTIAPVGLLQVGTSSSPGLLVTSSGNVGIGTSKPATKLDVSGGVYFDGGSGDVNGSGSLDINDAMYIAQYLEGGRTLSREELARADVNGDARIGYEDASTIASILAGFSKYIAVRENRSVYGTTCSGASGAGGWASGCQKTFFVNGNVGIGTNNPGTYKLYVNGPLAVNSDTAQKTGTTSWGTLSDVRLKDVTGEFDYGLDKIMQLRPVRYHYKKNNSVGADYRNEYIGFVAQDVQKIVPEAVRENNQGYLVIESDAILWTMLNAIKELKIKNEALERRISALGQSLKK